MSVGGITTNYPIGYGTGRAQGATTDKSFASQLANTTQANGIKQPLALQGHGSIFSVIEVQTGESIGIYYDEEAGGNNMIAKVINPDGSVKEIKINPDKVDPSNASFVEMLALSAHLKQQGKLDSVGGLMMSSGGFDRQGAIYEKYNILQEMRDSMERCFKYGFMDTYMMYLKEVTVYEQIAASRG